MFSKNLIFSSKMRNLIVAANSGVSRGHDQAVGAIAARRQNHSLPASYLKVNKWNKAVTEAESLVGYPTSYMSLTTLFNNDFTSMAVHLRKLMGSDHPVLKTAKRLFYDGKNNMQVRGLLILLLSRAARTATNTSGREYDANTGVLDSQRKLAEIIEMIHSAHCIHQSVINIPVNIAKEPDNEIRGVLSQLEYGNKISILSGDYLLANACTSLASFRVNRIVELVSMAISDFTQSEFFGEQDLQGRILPTANSISQSSWEQRWILGTGSLLGAGCESALILANAHPDAQETARKIGVHTGLAIQAHDEWKLFADDSGSSGPFCLYSAPVLFHLQSDPQLLEYLSEFKDDLLQVDYKKVREAVTQGDAVERTRELCRHHADTAAQLLRTFESNAAREGFDKILAALG